jgi:hypothetical protein
MATPIRTQSPFLLDPNNPMAQEYLGLERQQKLADLLTSKATQQPQGQMVSGRFVAPSWAEQLNPLVSAVMGQELGKSVEQKQLSLAEQLRKQSADEMMKYNQLRYGSPEQATYGAGEEGPTKKVTAPAMQANPRGAFEFALQSRSPLVNQMATEMLKPQKLGPEESLQVYNPTTGKLETIAEGKGKFHEPMKIDTGTGTLLLDPVTRQQVGFIPKAKGGPESLAATGSLRTSFIGETKPHQEIANAYAKVTSAPSSAAGDISKIFGYMKILDPGSTVREGEFATAQNATGVPGRITNLYNKVISGERLSPAQRAEFDQAAGALVQSQKQQYKGIEEHYTNIAKDAGVNPSHIVRDPYAGLDIKVPKAPTQPTMQETKGTGRYNPLRTPIGASQALGLPSMDAIDAELSKRK